MGVKGACVVSDLQEEDYSRLRQQMVQEQLVARGIKDSSLLDVMGRVQRHLFVPPQIRHMAYDDNPLPIGAGQTISQPYIVALMTQLLFLQGDERVLEVGVGSGYQTAILSMLAGEVVGLELVPELAQQARSRLAGLGCDNVTVFAGDGSEGLANDNQFDVILVAAASPGVPAALTEQLGDGGRMVIPVGNGKTQVLERIYRRGGALHIEQIVPVRFVPLLGKQGFVKAGG